MNYKKISFVGIGLLLMAACTNHQMSRAIPIPLETGIMGMETQIGFSREGKYLLQDSQRFSGIFETRFENGDLKSQATYKEGCLP